MLLSWKAFLLGSISLSLSTSLSFCTHIHNKTLSLSLSLPIHEHTLHLDSVKSSVRWFSRTSLIAATFSSIYSCWISESVNNNQNTRWLCWPELRKVFSLGRCFKCFSKQDNNKNKTNILCEQFNSENCDRFERRQKRTHFLTMAEKNLVRRENKLIVFVVKEVFCFLDDVVVCYFLERMRHNISAALEWIV